MNIEDKIDYILNENAAEWKAAKEKADAKKQEIKDRIKFLAKLQKV